MNLAWQVASRFRQGKRKNKYISFISFSSTLGIGLGCFVLITLLSIMNGFERELTHRILAVIPHGELFSVNNHGIENWQDFRSQLKQDPRIAEVEPYTKVTGMLQHKGELKAIEITGLDLNLAANDTWQQVVTEHDYATLKSSPDGVLLGQGIIDKLALEVGDKVQVLVPTVTSDLTFKAPKTMALTLAGALTIGGELDNYVGMMHLDYASQQTDIESGAQGLRFTLHDPFSANSTMREIGYAFPQAVYMSDWTRTQGHLYQDIQLVRTVVYVALTLVIAVACFNIVSTLVMAVREKRAAIAILKTMGAEAGLIRRIFILQGLMNGVRGIVCGTLAALLIAPNLSLIVGAIESLIGVQLLSGDIYFIDFLPSELHTSDVIVTVAVALLLTIVATLYPAHQASNVEPASALNG